MLAGLPRGATVAYLYSRAFAAATSAGVSQGGPVVLSPWLVTAGASVTSSSSLSLSEHWSAIVGCRSVLAAAAGSVAATAVTLMSPDGASSWHTRAPTEWWACVPASVALSSLPSASCRNWRARTCVLGGAESVSFHLSRFSRTAAYMRVTQARSLRVLTRAGWRAANSASVSTLLPVVCSTCSTLVTPCEAHLSISRSSSGVARAGAGRASRIGLWRRGWASRSSRGRSSRGLQAGSVSGSGSAYRRGGRAATALKAWRASPGIASSGPLTIREKERFRESISLPMLRPG